MRKSKIRHGEDTLDPLWTSSLKPAPGELRIVQAFVNTADLENKTDELVNPWALAGWLTRWGLLPRGIQLEDGDLAPAIEVREGLRALLRANNGASTDARAMHRLDQWATRAALVVRFDPDGTTRFETRANGLDGAFARLFTIVASARLTGVWPRLKACWSVSCRRAFYDFSPNQSGTWCTMQRCGNRAKARTARKRRSEGDEVRDR